MPIAPTEIALLIALILLAPLAVAGLSLINTGLGRSRSAAHTLLTSLCILAVAAGVYLICGFAWQGYIGTPAHVISVADMPWNWLARGPVFLRGLEFDCSPSPLAALSQMFHLAFS